MSEPGFIKVSVPERKLTVVERLLMDLELGLSLSNREKTRARQLLEQAWDSGFDTAQDVWFRKLEALKSSSSKAEVV